MIYNYKIGDLVRSCETNLVERIEDIQIESDDFAIIKTDNNKYRIEDVEPVDTLLKQYNVRTEDIYSIYFNDKYFNVEREVKGHIITMNPSTVMINTISGLEILEMRNIIHLRKIRKPNSIQVIRGKIRKNISVNKNEKRLDIVF